MAYETLLIVHMHSAGASKHYDLLEALKAQENGEGGRKYNLHDLRKSKCDNVTWKENVKKCFIASKKQKRTTFAMIDSSDMSSTNAFGKNVQRVVAIGVFKENEMKQFNGRMGRPCKLEEGDLVPEKFTSLHIKSEFASKLLSKADERVKDALPEELQRRLDRVAQTQNFTLTEKHEYGYDLSHLNSLNLTPDPVEKYFSCIEDDTAKDAFDEAEYTPLVPKKTHNNEQADETSKEQMKEPTAKSTTGLMNKCSDDGDAEDIDKDANGEEDEEDKNGEDDEDQDEGEDE